MFHQKIFHTPKKYNCYIKMSIKNRYKYLIFRPNNGSLIKKAFEKRPWWEVY